MSDSTTSVHPRHFRSTKDNKLMSLSVCDAISIEVGEDSL